MRLAAVVCRTDKQWPTKSWPAYTHTKQTNKKQVLCYDSHVAWEELNHGAPKTQFQIVCVTLGMFGTSICLSHLSYKMVGKLTLVSWLTVRFSEVHEARAISVAITLLSHIPRSFLTQVRISNLGSPSLMNGSLQKKKSWVGPPIQPAQHPNVGLPNPFNTTQKPPSPSIPTASFRKRFQV